MLRIPVKTRLSGWVHTSKRLKTSSSYIRSTFIEYFTQKHQHKFIRSSPVVPLCDPTVPFVNAGMNQFKGVFLGTVQPPCPRAVNSQKCVRVGGKHNDLDVVGTDGKHHTFFEMLGNWSFGDYYKKEACQMAWDLLLGPYRLKPENLVVTYFGGDAAIGLKEDTECRDIWKEIGVPLDRIRPLGASENFWEMGSAGPCGPCTEVHYINADGTLTEIWNIVFIQCNREQDSTVKSLRTQHVDTGMGLERMAALLQGVQSNYDTDLFQPIIRAIEKNSKGVSPYSGKYGADADLDTAYRRLADHSRMISVCLADGAWPANNLNLKQIMRKSFKISTDVFKNPNLLHTLYDQVCETLSSTYPELDSKAKEAKLIIQHEGENYAKLRKDLAKKWRDLARKYPEVEGMSDVELTGFAQGYAELKETMEKHNSTTIPAELVFKLYDTHGFQEDTIERVAELNNLTIDKAGFWKLLKQHKSRHKTALKEQGDSKGILFQQTIDKIIQNGVHRTIDKFKYDYKIDKNKIDFEPLETKLVAILNEDIEWVDFLEPGENKSYYVITKDTNFYCEEGGQCGDTGTIYLKNNKFKVDSVFKIRDFVFHKGVFTSSQYVNNTSEVTLEIDSVKRLKIMYNHTAVHLLNAALRKVLQNSVLGQIGSKVDDKRLTLNLSVYGEKLTVKAVMEAQDLVRSVISSNVPVSTSVIDSVDLGTHGSVVTVPGETYPETGLRLVTAAADAMVSKELCCGTHAPRTGLVRELCVTRVKGAGGHAPAVHAVTGGEAKEIRELFCRAEKLEQVIELVDPERMRSEATSIRENLEALCGGSGAPYGHYADCLKLLQRLESRAKEQRVSLDSIAEAEVAELFKQAEADNLPHLVHFLRCSYLMQPQSVAGALRGALQGAVRGAGGGPQMLLGCAQGLLHAACRVPPEAVTAQMSADRWLRCVVPVFGSQLVEAAGGSEQYAEMTPVKVSLINCEQLVQDAMRAANAYAAAHGKTRNQENHPAKNRTSN